MMGCDLILAESDFHLIQACSFALKFKNDTSTEILWIGSKDSTYFNFFKNKFQISHVDLTNFNFFNVEQISNNSKLISLKDIKINRLITFYDTHFFFEYLRSEFKISWGNIGLLDDGIGSLYKTSMPKIHRRIPKAIYNLFCRRFNVNLSLNTLGSNKKIKTFITIFKKNHHHAFVNPELIDIVREFKSLNKLISDENINRSNISGNIILTSPVLKYKRLSKEDFLDYLKNLLTNVDLNQHVYFKPHPREDLIQFTNVIKKLNIDFTILDQKLPIEFYFNSISDSTWIGMPSTAFLTRIILNPNSNDNYIILQENNDPFPGRIPVLETFFKSNQIKYQIL